MRSGVSGGIALVVLAAACGEPPPPRTVAPGPAAATATRVHVTPQPEPVSPRAGADIEALAAAYLAAWDVEDPDARSAARKAARDAIVAAGEDGARALVAAWTRSDLMIDDALVERLGADAVEPILEVLADPAVPRAGEFVYALGGIAQHWDCNALGPRVAERLMAVAAAYDGGADDGPRTVDEIMADEERGSSANDALQLLGWHPELAAPYAEDIARLYVRWFRLETDEGREAALETLAQLGTAAAPALPVLLAADKGEADHSQVDTVLWIAARVGSAAPEALPALLAATESDDGELRMTAVHALSAWGDGFPEIRARLVGLLRDPDEDVRMSAALALAESPADVPLVWRHLALSAEESRFGVDKEGVLLRAAVQDGDLGATIVAALPSLSAEELRGLTRIAAGLPPVVESAVVRQAAAHSDADVRATALRAWSRWPDVPPEARTLLRDAHARVRVAAADTLRRCAEGALGDEARAVLVAALGSADEDVADDAVRALASDDLPIAGVPPDAVRRLADRMLDDDRFAGFAADVLVRCEGGVAELERVLRPSLGTGFDPDGDGRAVVAALEGAGKAAAGLRDAVAAVPTLRRGFYADDLQRILNVIDGDAMAYAADFDQRSEGVALRLLDSGPDGALAAVVLYGTKADDDPWPAWQELPLLDVADPRLDAAVVRAARTTDGEHAAALRRGAARMLSRLPASQAVPLLVGLARDTDLGLRRDALRSLGEVALTSPGSIPADVVREALHDPETCHDGLLVVRAMGSHAGALSDEVRTIARDGPVAERLEATVLLRRFGDGTERVADLLRAVLDDAATAGTFDNPLWDVDDDDVWADVRAALLEAPPRESDVALFLRSRSLRASAYVPVLARLGPAAAPAVPHLRALLTDFVGGCGNVDWTYGEGDPFAEAIARAAVAIGPAARSLVPDLRRRAVQRGDANGVLRDAIRRLESGN